MSLSRSRRSDARRTEVTRRPDHPTLPTRSVPSGGQGRQGPGRSSAYPPRWTGRPTMPTPLFRLDLTRHLDPVLQLARARPDRVQLVAWAVRYLVENTDGLDVIIVQRPAPCAPSRCSGPRGSTPCGVRWGRRASAMSGPWSGGSPRPSSWSCSADRVLVAGGRSWRRRRPSGTGWGGDPMALSPPDPHTPACWGARFGSARTRRLAMRAPRTSTSPRARTAGSSTT